MGKRELFALVAIPVLLIAILGFPPWVFLVILGTAIVLAGDELLTMARGAGFDTGRWLPLAGLAAVLAASWVWNVAGLAVTVVVVPLVVSTARLIHPDSPTGSFGSVAAASYAVVFLGTTGACFGWLRLWPTGPHGARILLFFLASIWVGDSGAYYVGRNFGRHKMAPRLSPNKTWEGFAGGVLTTYAAAAAAAIVLHLGFGLVHTAVLATVLAAAAPVGDLVESQLKRDSGVKDSSSLLPGHGGFFDRTDSLLYAAPPVLGYLVAAGLL